MPEAIRCDLRSMSHTPIMETMTAMLFRLASYLVHNMIDDPALLAIVFC